MSEETKETKNTESQTNEEASSSKSAMPLAFDEWVGKQDKDIQNLIGNRFEALENTVRSTRQERDDFAKQIKELSSKADKGSDLEKSLTELSGKLESAEKRATFAEQGIKPEIGCTNIKAAYALAVTDDLFDKSGNPDWNQIKQTAPELFRKAGSTDGGAGGKTPPVTDINAAIRAAAGRT